MNTLETLQAARKLISDPRHWTQWLFARSSSGVAVSATDPAAVCWCAAGAVKKVNPFNSRDARECLGRETTESLTSFNDTHTHPEVLALFDKAISKLEATQA